MTVRHASSRRWLLFGSVLMIYGCAHLTLSRIFAHMVTRDWGTTSKFIYLPVRPDFVADHEMPWLYLHHALRCLFYPAWKIDHSLFGGPWPMTSMPIRGLDQPQSRGSKKLTLSVSEFLHLPAV